MRAQKLAEKQQQLRKMMNLIQPFKLNFGTATLPSIRQRNQNAQSNKIKSYQASPKVFINSQQALVWIKKDYDRKTKHDLLQMIRKKAQREFLIQQEGGPVKARQNKTKKYHSHMLRKYSSTSKCIKEKNKTQRKQFNGNGQEQEIKNNQNFLSIQVMETTMTMPRPSINSRIRTQRSKNQILNLKYKQKDEIDLQSRSRIKTKSQGKFINKSKLEQDSFRPQLLSPW